MTNWLSFLLQRVIADMLQQFFCERNGLCKTVFVGCLIA